jgi:hypothetical protein
MILATHAIVGAAVAGAGPGAVSAFFLGFGSHFLLDALPHWDYNLSSRQENPVNRLNDKIEQNTAFFLDLVKLSFDFGIGAVLVFRFLTPVIGNPWIVWFGVLGGVLPDFLQFIYFKLRWPILVRLQQFHYRVHTNYHLAGNKAGWGILSQAAVIILILIATVLFTP